MAAACASLPEALQQARYDLNALFQLEAALAAAAQAIRIDAQVATCLPTPARPCARRTASGVCELAEHRKRTAAEQAQAQLLHYWQNTQAGGTIDDWKKAVAAPHARARVPPSVPAWPRRCALPQASLAQSFAPAPVIWQDAERSTAGSQGHGRKPEPVRKQPLHPLQRLQTHQKIQQPTQRPVRLPDESVR